METVPPQLIELLERLGLAGAGQVRRMGGLVRRLARDLPRFESVWVDALTQARLLTPFQAAEIHAGRGESLRVGPYVLCESLPWPDYVPCFRARRIESREVVRLAVVSDAGKQTGKSLDRLEALAAVSPRVQSEHVACVTEVGAEAGRIWAASRWIAGRTAAKWMVHHGRCSPEVVLQIARAMLVALGELERAGLCHGDVSSSGLVLIDSGGVVLLLPGIRAILRPEEGYAHADLPPEAYDYLAPERIAEGTLPTTASDMYACGCVWWHLLCGRAPLAGGDSLGKLRAGQTAEVLDVGRFVPEIPAPLAAAVSACLQRDPGRRPQSMAHLAATLGSPTQAGKLALRRCLTRGRRATASWSRPARVRRQSIRTPLRLAALAGCLLATVALLWPNWRTGFPVSTASIPAGQPALAAQPAVAQTDPAQPPSHRTAVAPMDRRASSMTPGRANRQPAAADTESATRRRAEPPDLVLASGEPLKIESLELSAGQCVRGAPGQRPMVMVPLSGLNVDAEDVRFEDIDFVHDHPSLSQGEPEPGAAIVHLRAAAAEFRGCSFRSTRSMAAAPAAIRWTHPADSSESLLTLPSGRVRLSDCVLSGVGPGIECCTVGAVTLELANTLQVDSGPLVRLDHCPKSDEPILITLSQVTLRAAGPLLECRFQRIEDQPGEILVRASRCAFVPGSGTPLMRFVGPQSPQRVLQSVRWTGQGSLVSPETVVAAWQRPDGRRATLDDASVSIAGLVRSRVGFAGSAEAGPPASRIHRWQAPLRSTDPPGIDPTRLPPLD